MSGKKARKFNCFGKLFSGIHKSICMSCDSIIPFWGRDPIETHTCAKTCTRIFIATLFVLAKTGNPPNAHQQQSRQVNTLWHIPTVNYWTARKMNNLQPHTAMGMNFTNKILSERSQTRGCMQSDSIHKKTKIRQNESRLWSQDGGYRGG